MPSDEQNVDRDQMIIEIVDLITKGADGWCFFYYQSEGDHDYPGYYASNIREVPYIADIGLKRWEESIDRAMDNLPDDDDDDDDE
jgi:hypothetical protein